MTKHAPATPSGQYKPEGMTLRDWESTLADRERDRRANAYPQLVATLRACYDRSDPLACTNAGLLLRSLGEV